LNARAGRRDAPGKVLKDRRSPRQRGRMGTGVNQNAPCRCSLSSRRGGRARRGPPSRPAAARTARTGARRRGGCSRCSPSPARWTSSLPVARVATTTTTTDCRRNARSSAASRTRASSRTPRTRRASRRRRRRRGGVPVLVLLARGATAASYRTPCTTPRPRARRCASSPRATMTRPSTMASSSAAAAASGAPRSAATRTPRATSARDRARATRRASAARSPRSPSLSARRCAAARARALGRRHDASDEPAKGRRGSFRDLGAVGFLILDRHLGFGKIDEAPKTAAVNRPPETDRLKPETARTSTNVN